jgi:hypothetical protein
VLAASLACVLLLMTACTAANPFRPAEEVSESQVEIVEPANFSNTWRGHTIRIRALIREPDGISQVQLQVNGEAISTEIPSGAPLTTHVTQDLYWTPSAVGPYEIRAAVKDTAGEWSPSLPITLIVVEAPPATVVAAPTATAPAVVAGGPAQPQPTLVCPCPPRPPKRHGQKRCYDNAAFVEDVSIPDNTLLDRGVRFDKTWRLRNISNYTWTTGYELVFVGGDQMGAPNAVPLPHEVPPGATVDITVPMTAPNAAGTFRGQWQLRSPVCNFFGPIVYVLIQVRPGAGDLPLITRFDVAPSPIDPGQSATLTWESLNGTSARLYPDGQSVELSGSRTVSPNATTEYRLVVENASGPVERTVTLFVRTGPAPPPPSAPPPASPANLAVTAVRTDGFDFTWVDASSDEQGFRLYNADTRQVIMTFGSNVASGGVGGLACGTPYRFYLVAFNQSGESWPSNTVQANTSPCS